MRLGGPFVVVLLLLALAPVASAHDEAEPNHSDTGAQLAGADINRALAVAGMASTVAPDLPQFLPTTWCGSERTTDDTVHAAYPASAAQIKVVYAYAEQPDRQVRARGATRCRPTSRASSSTWRCRPAAAAPCASTWAPSAARSTSTSRSSR